MGRYDRQKDNFDVYGPTHLTKTEVNWNNEEHRRCITACLVKATYILEREHQISQKGGTLAPSLAPAWWGNFHFHLHHTLRSGSHCKSPRRIFRSQSTRSFIYGAVFEYVPPDDAKNRHPSSAPHYVDYFQKREQVKDWSTRVANSAATQSYRDMVYSVLGQQSERQHLLPCAVMWTNSHGDDPHGLPQWWQPTGPKLALRRDEYSWPLI